MLGAHLIRIARQALVAGIVVVSVAVLSAQTVVDPRTVEFDPSPDHNAVSNGSYVVQSYSLGLYQIGASTPFTTVNLGKPSPATDGKIRVDFIPLLGSVPPPNVTYEARVTAIGPGGSAASSPSNSFSFTVPCTFDIDPDSVAASATGVSGSFTLTTGTTCSSSATSSASWITVTNGSGTGSRTIGYSIGANSSTSPRNGTISVGGLTFSVQQAGAPCSYTISPSGQSMPSGTGSGSFTVNTGGGCSWTPTSSASWLTVGGSGARTGTGTVNFSVAANPNTTPRTATISAGGQTFAVNQAAAPCTYALSATSGSVPFGGGTGSFNVTTPSSCTWTASSSAGWLTVMGSPGGTGNGTVNFSASANPNTSTRTGTITVNGQTFTVNQAAAPCTYSISSSSANIPSTGGGGSFGLTAGANCSWTATDSASWITVSAPTTGSGNATISFTVTANSSSSQRSGTISVGGRTFTISQAGTSCTYSVDKKNQKVPPGGGKGSATVTSNAGCSWHVTSEASWITVVDGGSYSGTDTAEFSVAANPETSERIGTLTIAGEVFTVTQDPAPCTYTIAPAGQAFVSAGGPGSFAVTAGGGCSWSATSSAAWIAIAGAGSGAGNGTVGFSVAANTGSIARTGTISVNGQTFTVTQAEPCSYSISASGGSVPSTGGTGSFGVTAGNACSWSAASNATWLTVTGTPAGAGNGTVTFSASTNPDASERTATISVGGRTFTVTQEAASSCTYTMSPTSRSMSNIGGSNLVYITTQAGCTWTASSNTSWLSISVGASRTGTATATYRGTTNSGAPRVGTLTVAGYTFTVNQNGICSYSVSPASQTIPAGGSSGQLTVTTSAGCAWNVTMTATWITLANVSGSGPGSVTYNVAPNTTGSTRYGWISINGQTVSFTQPKLGPPPPTTPVNLRIVGGKD